MTWAAWVIGAGGLLMGCNQIAGIYDFTDEDPNANVGGGGRGGAGAGGGEGGAEAGGGGAGGAGIPDCVSEGVDLDTDPQHCGACDVDCVGGLCANGVCSPVDLTLDMPGPLARLDGQIIVVLRNPTPRLAVIPEDFDNATPVIVIANPGLADGLGTLTAGPDRVYYTAQSSADVHSCTASACVTQNVTLANGAHFNSMVVVEGNPDLLYLLASQPDHKLYTMTLDASGIAVGSPSVVLDDLLEQPGTDGPHILQYVPASATFYISTYGLGGCVYEVPSATLPNLNQTVACSAGPADGVLGTFDLFANADRILVDVGEHVVQLGDSGMFGPMGGGAPLAADATHAFIGSDSGGMYVLDDAGGTLALVGTGNVRDIDASHPDFVFFTTGSSLFRWRKLPSN